MNRPYLVQPLSAAKHRRNEFSCEEPELAEFLHHRAIPEMEARASACFVLAPKDDPGRVAGFYTLSAATISLARLPPELTTQLPKYPNLPATLLGGWPVTGIFAALVWVICCSSARCGGHWAARAVSAQWPW